jgi:hypothetical protein
MKTRMLRAFLIVLSILAFVTPFFMFTKAAMPKIGHDYRLFIPSLLDTSRLVDGGSFFKVGNGNFNMKNPTSLVFPQ